MHKNVFLWIVLCYKPLWEVSKGDNLFFFTQFFYIFRLERIYLNRFLYINPLFIDYFIGFYLLCISYRYLTRNRFTIQWIYLEGQNISKLLWKDSQETILVLYYKVTCWHNFIFIIRRVINMHLWTYLLFGEFVLPLEKIYLN